MATTSELLQQINESAAANTQSIAILTEQMAGNRPSGLVRKSGDTMTGPLVNDLQSGAKGQAFGHAVMPYTEINAAEKVNGSSFTATHDGWAYAFCTFVRSVAFGISVARSNSLAYIASSVGAAGGASGVLAPVAKGDVVTLIFPADGSSNISPTKFGMRICHCEG